MFIVALFTRAKTWKRPTRPSTDEWIKKMWHIFTMEYYSAIKRNEILPFAAPWMVLEIIILSEVSHTERDRYDITYMWNLKHDTNEQKQTHRHGKQTYGLLLCYYGYQRGKRVRSDKVRVRDW